MSNSHLFSCFSFPSVNLHIVVSRSFPSHVSLLLTYFLQSKLSSKIHLFCFLQPILFFYDPHKFSSDIAEHTNERFSSIFNEHFSDFSNTQFFVSHSFLFSKPTQKSSDIAPHSP